MKKYLMFLLIIVLLVSIPQSVLAWNWATESHPGIPSLGSAYVDGTWPQVNSSWNEPRSSEIHKGADHVADYNTPLGPMYNNATASCTDWGSVKVQKIKYTYNNNTFYTIYLHISTCVKTGTVYVGDTTAKSGDTGSAGSPHLHFEINPTDPGTGGGRVSVNPHDYVVDRQKQRSVFKDWNVNYISSNVRKVEIVATNFNLTNIEVLSEVDIYYRDTGTSTWYGPYSMSGDGTGVFTYNLSGSFGTTYDVVIAGRRSSTEYWVTYPALKYTEIGKSSTIPMSNWSDWVTKQVSF